MTRINTNLSSIVGKNILGRNQAALQTSLTRLSTGLRINSGKDDPAGLIASEVLGRELTSIDISIKNTERGNNIVATADAALKEVSSLLNDIRGLVQSSANKGAISTAEIASNQVQLDSALDSITRIAQTTVFGGDKLLNGNKAFTVNATGGSLGTFQSTADITINSFDPSLHTSSVGDDVSVAVTRTARQKTVSVKGGDGTVGNGIGLQDLSLGTSTRTTTTVQGNTLAVARDTSLNALSTNSTRRTQVIDHSGATSLAALTGTGTDTVTFQVVGDLGTATVAVNVDDAQADSTVVVDAINSIKAQTGVTASNGGVGTADITLTSNNVGAGAALAVTVTAATQAGDVALGNAAVDAAVAGTTGAVASTTFTITGNKGSATVNTGTLANGNDSIINGGIAGLATLINTRTNTTGVTASVSSGNLVLTSGGVGSTSLASITAGGGDAALIAGSGTTATVTGTDGTSNTTTLEVIGDLGRSVITITNDAVINNSNALTNAINAVSDQTGVTASGTGNGADVTLTSQKYGSAANVQLNAIAATNSADVALFSAAGTQRTTAGVDAAGTVTRDGATGNFSAVGEVISYADSGISLTGVTSPTLKPATYTTTTLKGSGGGLSTLTPGTPATNTVSFSLTGNLGSVNLTGINVSALQGDSRLLVDAINANSGTTGVTASTTAVSGSFAGTDIVLTASTPGSAGTISLQATAATVGADVGNFNVAGSFTATTAGVDAPTSAVSNFDVSGGALFQLGASVTYTNQININIPGVDLATLGRNFSSTGAKAISALKTGGSDQLSSTDLSTAASIVEQAISEIATLRGRLGALQKNVFDSNVSSLQSAFEQVTQARSTIRDADFAAETAALTKNQILVQAGTSVLAIANSSPQSVLALLQR